MFPYRLTTTIVTTLALLQPPIVIAQDIAEVNNIARNISVKITGSGNGSGFIIERVGNVYSVVTNKHVVPIEAEYEIQTYDGTKHQVTDRQEIPDLDLAIIQFESNEEYEVAELGDSDELNLQQTISVAGFPGEQIDIDIVRGDIRSIREEIIANPEQQQGYALNYTNQTLPGSSGGAVLDDKGRVVAINGEGETNIKTGREISRGIPINIFLEAEEKLLAAENNTSETTTNASGDYQLKHTLSDHSIGVLSVAVSKDKIVSGGIDNTIKVWNLTTGELERTLYDYPHSIYSGSVLSVAVSKDKIVSGNLNSEIKVWNLTTGELERTLYGHSSGVGSVALSEDKIVSGSYDNTIKVWNLTTGKLKQTITGHPGSVLSVAVSENRIVSGGDHNTIKVWNLTTGELERTIIDNSIGLGELAVNGGKIVNGNSDNTIKIWNFETGEVEQTLIGHFGYVNSVAISKDKIISGSQDKTIKVWQLQK